MSNHSIPDDARPDLDENINVAQAHQSIGEDPAVGRENRLLENGMEPVSLFLILISAVVVLVGGAVMGQGGSFFNYDEVVKSGYMRAPSPVKEPDPVFPGPAMELYMKAGGTIYGSACASCHGPSGGGGASAPPLAGSEWVTGKTAKFSQIALHGVTGPIMVAGTEYNFPGGMQSMRAQIGGTKELAALMTFIRNSWGNQGSIVTQEMAKNAFDLAKERDPSAGQTTAEELLKNYDIMLEGAELAPDTLVDPKTLLPVEAPAE